MRSSIVATSQNGEIHSVHYWELRYSSPSLNGEAKTDHSMIYIDNPNESQRNTIQQRVLTGGFEDVAWCRIAGAKLHAELIEM